MARLINMLENRRTHKPYVDSLASFLWQRELHDNPTELPSTIYERDARGWAIRFIGGLLSKIDDHAWDMIAKARNEYRIARDTKDDQRKEYALECVRIALYPEDERERVPLQGFASDFAAHNEQANLEQELHDIRMRFRSIYERLKREHGLETYQEVADLANISVGTAWAIEHKNTLPQLRTRKRLATAFKKDPYYFEDTIRRS